MTFIYVLIIRNNHMHMLFAHPRATYKPYMSTLVGIDLHPIIVIAFVFKGSTRISF